MGETTALTTPRRAGPTIRYEPSHKAWDFTRITEDLVRTRGARRICELGAGANPALGLDFVEQHQLDYLVVDVAAGELGKAHPRYRTLVADVTGADFDLEGSFDLIVSRMLAEHVSDPEGFHRNVHRALVDGGTAFHFFPTLYSLPFVLNRLLPDQLTERILLRYDPTRTSEGSHAKFPAYYRWCLGPVRRQIVRFERLGYVVDEYVGFFGHSYYKSVGILRGLSGLGSGLLLRHPRPHLTSYAHVLLRRPGTGT